MHARGDRRRAACSRIVVAGVAVLALAGCDGASASLGAASQELLHERVAQVRAAADSSERDEAIAAVEAFRAAVQRLLDAGELTDAEAAGLFAHADAIATQVLANVVAPTPSPTPTPAATPAPVAAPPPEVTSDGVHVLEEETAARLNEMLRERLAEYIEQRMAERQAERGAEEKAEEKAEKKAEKKAEREHRDRDQGGPGAH